MVRVVKSDQFLEPGTCNSCTSRAGAHWLPHSRAHEPVICDWDVQTYDYWLDVLRREEEDRTLPRSGLAVSLPRFAKYLRCHRNYIANAGNR